MVNERIDNQSTQTGNEELTTQKLNHDMVEKISQQLWNQINNDAGNAQLSDWQMWR